MVGYEDFLEDAGHTRRSLIKAGAATTVLGAVGGGAIFRRVASAQDAMAVDEETAATAVSCLLTPELTEGPYYLDDALIRQDITEGKEGIPLTLRINVVDTTSCTPLTNVAVDIWHCDSHGYYSGVEGNNPGPDADQALIEEAEIQTFLRGVQITDENGVAEFATIYPGWYISRTIHIHMKVIVDGEAGTTYEDGHVAHTGQLFFDEETTEAVLALPPYNDRPNEQRTTNDEDNILADHEDEEGFLVSLTPITEGTIADGFIGVVTIGVDPDATPSGVEAGGGGQGGPQGGGQPGGAPPDGNRPGGTPPQGGN